MSQRSRDLISQFDFSDLEAGQPSASVDPTKSTWTPPLSSPSSCYVVLFRSLQAGRCCATAALHLRAAASRAFPCQPIASHVCAAMRPQDVALGL